MKKICKVTNSALVSGALLLSLIGITPVHALETGDDSSLKNVSNSDSYVSDPHVDERVLSASKKEILVGKDSAEVIFYFETLINSDEYVLYQNDVPIGYLVDSGNYAQDGDDIKGDGIYSIKFTVDVTGNNAKPTENSKIVYNTYSVRCGDSLVSNEISIDLITPFSDQDLIDMSVVDNDIDELVKSDKFKSMNQQEKIDALMELLTTLSENKLVNSIVLSEDRIEFIYSSDASGMILFSSFGEGIDGIITGDANGDGKLAASDAAFIAKELAEASINSEKITAEAYPAMDFNQDGQVTAKDAAATAKYLAEQSIKQ